MKIIEKILQKLGYIKISKAKNIAETFTKYMIEDIQKLVLKDFKTKADPTYQKEMLGYLDKTFKEGLKVDRIEYELQGERDYVLFGYNN